MQNLIEFEQSTNFQTKNVSQEVEKSRALQEVQALIFAAKIRPRDEFLATKKILEAAKRLSLAEKATYCYPRAGEQIQGPSIRAAETLAKYWGNLDFGIKELSQNPNEHSSEVMAYCWDLENNVRQTKVFTVQHVRYSKSKGFQTLIDPRDIYEKVANDGARRLRACILGIMPSDIVEDFIQACNKTIEGGNGKPLKECLSNMLEKFETLGVTKDMLEKRIGTKFENFVPKNLVDLGSVYNSIKNNFAPVEQYFELPTLNESVAENLKQKALNKDEGKNANAQQ